MMNLLIQWRESFNNVYRNQITTLKKLNILKICQLKVNKSWGKNYIKKRKEQVTQADLNTRIISRLACSPGAWFPCPKVGQEKGQDLQKSLQVGSTWAKFSKDTLPFGQIFSQGSLKLCS